MCSSNWGDGEIRELLTIAGEKAMQLHQTASGKDLGESSRGTFRTPPEAFVWIKKTCGQQNKEYVGVFAHVNS